MVTLSLHQRKLFEEAAAGQVCILLVLGCILTLADPRLGDAGLAIAVMAPILASLVGRRQLRRQSWALLAGIVVLGGTAATLGGHAIPVEPGILMATAITAFVTCVGLVAHTA